MTMITSLLFLLFAVLQFSAVSGDDDTDNKGFVVAGYLPDYRIHAYMENMLVDDGDGSASSYHKTTEKLTSLTDLILFSFQPNKEGRFDCCLHEDHFELVQTYLNRSNNNIAQNSNVWITIGGGGRTEHFPTITSNKKLRTKLIQSVVDLSTKYSFISGIDLDFFTPRTRDELNNYLLFLQEAIRIWHTHNLKVSITLHPNPQQARMIPSNIYQLLDRIHFMAYDMIDHRSYHASVEKVKQTVKELLNLPGITPQKILLGVPAYARHLQNPSQVKTFGEIYDSISPNKHQSMHSWNGYGWESVERIQNKIKFVHEKQLGGIFVWELGQDKFLKNDKHYHSNVNGYFLDTILSAVDDITVSRSNNNNDDMEL